MQELLVLGIIPGTDIQITFIIWLIFMAAAAIATLSVLMKRRHTIRNVIITYFVARQTRRTQA